MMMRIQVNVHLGGGRLSISGDISQTLSNDTTKHALLPVKLLLLLVVFRKIF